MKITATSLLRSGAESGIVYTSWIDEKLCDYNSSLYYQSRDYIAECYRAGHVIDA